MVWNFLKKILNKKKDRVTPPPVSGPECPAEVGQAGGGVTAPETLACRGPLALSATEATGTPEGEKRPEAEPRAAFRQNARISAAASPASAPSAAGPVKAEAEITTPPASEPEVPACARASADTPALVEEKSHAEKTDEELVQELNAISPEILSQAKNPQMRKLIIGIYRKMLIEGVDIKDEKEVKKWLKKHPEAVNGGEAHKIETFKRGGPKVGRNDVCPCGSGRKYKKCCGKGK